MQLFSRIFIIFVADNKPFKRINKNEHKNFSYETQRPNDH